MVTIGFDPATYSVPEGAGSVSVTVVAQGSLARDVVVTLSTMDGTAVGGCMHTSDSSIPLYAPLFLSAAPGDYTPITMQLTFSDAMPSQTVPITITGDDMLEGPETFNVTLTSSDNAVTVDPMSATVHIVDDDGKLLKLLRVCTCD